MQPIAAMHCRVICLQGMLSVDFGTGISAQSITTASIFETFSDAAGGAMAIAVDCPISPNAARVRSRRRTEIISHIRMAATVILVK